MPPITRRRFLQTSLSMGGAVAVAGARFSFAAAAKKPGKKIAFGLVTYQWGKDWDLPTLLENCAKEIGRAHV